MDRLTGIRVFRQVVESGSFVAAADRLEMSTAMVSKHVMRLEKRLGVRLLNRNTRALSLTEPGRVYFERCKPILDDLEATELELGSLGTVPRGTLRITCPSWFAGQQMADVLVQFRHGFPEILVDASFEDRLVDLVEEGYDLAMRVAPAARSLPAGLIARPLRPMPFFIMASRAYLKARGEPHSPEDLTRHDFVAVGGLESLTLLGPDGRIEVPIRPVVRYRAMAGVANAVAAGIGIAPLSGYFLDDPLFQDTLVPILTRYSLQEATLYLVYGSRKYLPLKTRAFIDFAIEHVARLPAPSAP